jgi:hypothetical protein
MNVVLVYLRLYGNAAVTALKAIGKNPWTLLLPMGLAIAAQFAGTLVAPLGIIGGYLLMFALIAGTSAYLYFTGEVVARSTTSVKELRKGFGAFFWSVMGLQFVLWIANWGISMALEGTSKKAALTIAITLIEAVALNAAPETIYIKGTRGGIDTITASFNFLQENWIEWFIPNGLLLAGVYGLVVVVLPALSGSSFWIAAVVLALGAGALFHVVMVFRGVLYLALDGTSHRQRMYKYRTGQ